MFPTIDSAKLAHLHAAAPWLGGMLACTVLFVYVCSPPKHATSYRLRFPVVLVLIFIANFCAFLWCALRALKELQ